MYLKQSISIAITVLTVQGCASAPRVLSVRSDPADAEVCIKGKHKSQHFRQAKSCIGSTPLEVDSVTIADDQGRKRLIRFNELDQEQFYLIVSRPGYAPQSMAVPGWEHFVSLRQEQSKPEAAITGAAVKTSGAARISSDPVGALVYVNSFLKGNTPYVLEGENGQTIRLKIEQAGYLPIERSITIETGKTLEINLSMEEAGEEEEMEEVAEVKKEVGRNLASETKGE